ncbi:MAG: thioredoxin-like protein [Variovorax sp.]|nr:thioredoxin-like protein [Variovorax sp.]
MVAKPVRRRWLFGGIAALAAAAGAGGALWRHRVASLVDDAVGADFWSRSFEQPGGGTLSLSDLRQKPLLVNFWATWCPPCVEELPLIDSFFRNHAANGWQVVGLAIDQPSAVRKFLQRTPVGFPIGLAGLDGMELVRQLGNTGGGLPFTVVLDAGGTVLGRKIGQLQPADLERWQRSQVRG